MLQTELNAMYVLWLREMKRYIRSKGRIFGSLGMPFFFLLFLGTGFKSFMPYDDNAGVDYINFLAPGILAFVLQFGSMFTGMAILWDRQFGFLKEIMVAPVSRISIVLGRTAGGVSTTVLQGLLFITLALFIGLKIESVYQIVLCLGFMVLIAASFVNVGVAVSSFMKDMQGFSLVMNFLMVPMFLLSSALFPLDQFPGWVKKIALFNPLLYGVDGLRYSLIGHSQFPLWLDFTALIGFCLFMTGLGAFLFSRLDVE